MILTAASGMEVLSQKSGGKALNLARLQNLKFPVPEWFVIGADALVSFHDLNGGIKLDLKKTPSAEIEAHALEYFLKGKFPENIYWGIDKQIKAMGFEDTFVAVRSSGLDEDSADHSFAGQFSSFLFQKGPAAIEDSIRRCWASAYSARGIEYRRENGLNLKNILMGVVVQKMVNAEKSGIAFSHNPIHPLDRQNLVISAAWGLCEGIVSGELDADNILVDRDTLKAEIQILEKSQQYLRKDTGGLIKTNVPQDRMNVCSLSDQEIKEVARLVLDVAYKFGKPQDCEWAYEGGKLYFVQARPITTIPRDAVFNSNVSGSEYILWDNSNIVESYSGVTSPLTFTFASHAYMQVYIQFHALMGVPAHIIENNEKRYRNTLGLVRGRVYYNLINWYWLVLMMPGAGTNKGFMDTMMGVKQGLNPDVAKLFDGLEVKGLYSPLKKLILIGKTLSRFWMIDSIISEFTSMFDRIYQANRKRDFQNESLQSLANLYQELDQQLLKNWKAPIINDYLCMVFFGGLKALTTKWVESGDAGASLQNDLLCGQGNLESTEPTKELMRISRRLDTTDADARAYVMGKDPAALRDEPRMRAILADYLDRYGFRCINELKLEEADLHEDPTFTIQSIQSILKTKSYDLEAMEKRETEIREKAEAVLKTKLSGFRSIVYNWVLKHTRHAVRNRENLRFLRTKVFGIVRHIFRGMGAQLVTLGHLDHPKDIFYLTLEEIFAFIEGRSVNLDLRGIVLVRKKEFAKYEKSIQPPERFMGRGAAGAFFQYDSLVADADLLRDLVPKSNDPNLLYGTPCCPGVVEGEVLVVRDIADIKTLNGQILVTERTDPGWVPLYPSCSGLLIERGSLLSHSAVVARELGLPTIVGVSGGLVKKLKTGMRVRIDAGKGEIRILN